MKDIPRKNNILKTHQLIFSDPGNVGNADRSVKRMKGIRITKEPVPHHSHQGKENQGKQQQASQSLIKAKYSVEDSLECQNPWPMTSDSKYNIHQCRLTVTKSQIP